MPKVQHSEKTDYICPHVVVNYWYLDLSEVHGGGLLQPMVGRVLKIYTQVQVQFLQLKISQVKVKLPFQKHIQIKVPSN